MRHITEDGLRLIRRFEGFSALPYVCPGGYLTVGYGHVVKNPDAFRQPLTEDEATQILVVDIQAAEKAGKRIAVEVKSFLSASPMHDLELALGQFLLYRSILEEQEPERGLFLAIPDEASEIFDEPVGQLLIAKHLIRALVFDPQKEEIVRWIP